MSQKEDDPKLRIARRKAMDKAIDYACENDLENLKEIMEDTAVRLPVDPKPVEGVPPENSLLGEAAIGNAVDCVKYLLGLGADPNYVGEKQRTVLVRAFHNNALDVIPLLLAAGADPRLLLIQPRDPEDPSKILIRDWDSSCVEEAMSLPYSIEAKALLKTWDPKLLQLGQQRDQAKQATKKALAESHKAESAKLSEGLQAMKDRLAALKLKEREAFENREEQIKIYDLAKVEGKQHGFEIQDGIIKKAEKELEELRAQLVELEFKVKQEKARVREFEVSADGGLTFMTKCSLHDVSDTISGPLLGRHPYLFVDAPNNECLTFMSYRNQFMVRDIGNTKHYLPENIILDVLMALRWGRTYTIEGRDLDLATEVIPRARDKIEAASKGLWGHMCKRTVTQKVVYESLITDALVASNPDLTRSSFRSDFVEKFRLVIVTVDQYPDQSLLNEYGSVQVVISK